MSTIIETEAAIVGSGPGGATIARELALRGRQVVLIEKGKWHRWPVGRLASHGTITNFIRSRQGGIMGRGVTIGGSSVIFNGNAFDPPDWLLAESGLNLTDEIEETKAELNTKPLPPSYYSQWTASRRLVEAAFDLGFSLVPQAKFIDPKRCNPSCDDCMLGCRRGAKWTAREYIEQAQQGGAQLLANTTVNRVIIEDGVAKGVQIEGFKNVSEIRASQVILSAGGIGTPRILFRSGIQAGRNFFIDPMNVVMGVGRERGTYQEMTFSYASEESLESNGYLVGNIGSLTSFGAQLMRNQRFRALFQLPNLTRVMGMFTKIADTPSGQIHENGTIDKPYPEEDQVKFVQGTEACKQILIRAGVIPDTLCIAENIGGHPGGTAAIGDVVDRDLQTFQSKNLYICDASVFPRSLGRPPTLTIIAMAKHLAKAL